MGGGNTPGGVSPHPQGAWLASTIQWANLCLETAFPFCCPPWQTKSCSELLTLRVWSTYMHNALKGHSNTKAGSASSEGSACRFTTWSRRGGNLGHVSRPGSQDNVRVDRPKHKALFAYRKRLEVPDPFDGSERGQERCFKRQELQLDWVQQLKGAPLKSSQDDREGTRGGLEGFILLAPFRNLTMTSCFPRDRPCTASWWAAIAATCTFKVEGDSLRYNLSCRKESTTPIVHLRGSSRREEHQVANRLHFSA